MKNMTKNKNKIYSLIALAVIIGFLAFLQSDTAEYSYQISILERSAIYAVVAVSMNLLTGFTGLFSLGQAGFMAIGAYVVAIFTIPVGSRASVYYVSGISPVIANIQLPIPGFGGILAPQRLQNIAPFSILAPHSAQILLPSSSQISSSSSAIFIRPVRMTSTSQRLSSLVF